MASETEEAIIELGQCKCCLNDNDLRDLWAEYICSETGESEIYGEMLIDCYFLSWSPPEDNKEEYICETCVHRLRDAYNFKNDILQSERLLSEVGTTEFEDHPSKQNSKHSNEINEVEYLEENPRESCDEEEDSGDEIYLELTEDVQDEDFEEVEYLEEELTGESNLAPIKSSYNRNKSMVAKDSNKNQYKNYSAEKTVAVSLQLSLSEAKYQAEESSTKRKKHKQLVTEVQTLLSYTNVTIFKTRVTRFHCAYCPSKSPSFENPDHLRTHTRATHSDERIESVDKILRPSYANEIVKVDTENLFCTVCVLPIANWDNLLSHLKQKHDVTFTEARCRIIPYALSQDFKCGVCLKTYLNFHNLNSHMNKHFQNFQCPECKETFVSLTRCKMHQQVHVRGQYPCEVCGKVFNKELYRRKHMAFVHSNETRFKCLYCPSKFSTEYSRHQHVVEFHNSMLNIITCELCGKSFDWRPYYYKHLRRYHQKVCKYQCRYCSAKFVFLKERKKHEGIHKAESKAVKLDMMALHKYLIKEQAKKT